MPTLKRILGPDGNKLVEPTALESLVGLFADGSEKKAKPAPVLGEFFAFDPRDKTVVIRYDVSSEIMSSARVRKSLEKVRARLMALGALDVIAAPTELKFEVMSDEDLDRIGLMRKAVLDAVQPGEEV